MSFYTLLTTLGAAALTNAYAANTTVNLTQIAVGDGNGAAIVPAEGMTALVREKHRVPLSSLFVDPGNPNWLVAEAVIPATIGGWTVREVGIFTAAGILLAVGNFPETYKPELAEGSARDLLIRMIFETGNAAQVTLQIDPAVVMVSRKALDDAIAAHEAKTDPHPQYLTAAKYRARRLFLATI